MRDHYSENEYQNITDYIHEKSESKIIADISNIEEAKMAKKSGADFIASTLRGHTSYSKKCNLPDIEFIKKLKPLNIEEIIAEGGYSTHSDYIQALENGAKIVVIGTAITRPHLIVKKIITGYY